MCALCVNMRMYRANDIELQSLCDTLQRLAPAALPATQAAASLDSMVTSHVPDSLPHATATRLASSSETAAATLRSCASVSAACAVVTPLCTLHL